MEEDSSDSDDLDDEEVSLGSMDEEDFGLELEEEGGTFVDPDEDDGESGSRFLVYLDPDDLNQFVVVSVPELEEEDEAVPEGQ